MKEENIANIVNNYFNSNNYNVEYINIQKNSINGIVYYGKQKCFFKVLEIEDMNKEIAGYMLLKQKYPVSSIIDKVYFKEFRYYYF